MRTILSIMLTLAFASFLGCGKQAANDAKKPADTGSTLAAQIVPQTTCPIMDGNKINKNIYVDHNGKRVYFCCRACVARFKEDPDKYVKQLEDEGITLDKTPEGGS